MMGDFLIHLRTGGRRDLPLRAAAREWQPDGHSLACPETVEEGRAATWRIRGRHQGTGSEEERGLVAGCIERKWRVVESG